MLCRQCVQRGKLQAVPHVSWNEHFLSVPDVMRAGGSALPDRLLAWCLILSYKIVILSSNWHAILPSCETAFWITILYRLLYSLLRTACTIPACLPELAAPFAPIHAQRNSFIISQAHSINLVIGTPSKDVINDPRAGLFPVLDFSKYVTHMGHFPDMWPSSLNFPTSFPSPIAGKACVAAL